jgi:hypothetical protein
MRVDGWKQGKRRFSYQGKTLKAFTPAEGAAEKAKVICISATAALWSRHGRCVPG